MSKASDRNYRKVFESWITRQYGGEDAKQAVSNHAEALVIKAGITRPPVRLAQVAKTIGIDPVPVYEPDSPAGGIRIIDGHMRIVLQRRSGSLLPRESPDFKRMRFTYAHELAHAMFYDLRPNPPVRLAPEGAYRSEEQLCNRAASRFLVPEFLLRPILLSRLEPSPELFTDLATRFQTSLQTVAYRVAESASVVLKPNLIYILSGNATGIRGLGVAKPRCLVCIVPPTLRDQGVSFLKSYQGISHIKRTIHHRSVRWSLMEFFQNKCFQTTNGRLEAEEVVECPDGSVLELKTCHRTLGSSGMVWTEATITLLEHRS